LSSYSYINVNVNINIYDMLQDSYSRFSNHPFPTEVLDQKKIVHFAEEHLICRSFPAAYSLRAGGAIGDGGVKIYVTGCRWRKEAVEKTNPKAGPLMRENPRSASSAPARCEFVAGWSLGSWRMWPM
jgi:hypothetical protein